MSRSQADDRARKRPEWVRLPHREVDIVEGYAQWSRIYDEDIAAALACEVELVLDLLDGLEFETALDAAAGTGRHLGRLAKASAIVALDQSREMLALAAARNQRTSTSFARGELSQLPFDDGRFDLVVCAMALCHLPQLEPAVAELSRVLRPGGHLLVSDFHPAAVE